MMTTTKPGIVDILDLSPLQHGMLFHALESGLDPHIIQEVLTIDGAVDVELVRRAFTALLARHDVLCSRLVHRKVKTPKLVVLAEPTVDFEVVHATRGESEGSSWERFLENDRRRGFDLEQDALVRMAVYVESASRFRLLVTTHHIIMDGWCLGPFFGELRENVRALARGGLELRGQPRDRSYALYLAWLGKQDFARAREHFRKTLAAKAAVVPLPWYRETKPRSGQEDMTWSLGVALSREIRTLAQSLQVTPSSLLQAAWGVLCAWYADADDIVFGTVVSGRPPELPECSATIGLFINALPVRVRVGEATFAELAHAMHQQLASAASHAYLPLPEIQRAAGVSGPLFDHLFVVENYPLSADLIRSGDDDDWRLVDFQSLDGSAYDFSVIVRERGAEYAITFKHDPARCEPEFLRRVREHFVHVLTELVQRPDRAVSECDPMSADERQRVLVEFNATASTGPVVLFYERFLAQVANHSTRPGIVDGATTLSYRDVQRLAAQLGARMRALGAGPGRVVAVLGDNSWRFVVACLGVAAAGGTLCPIDPANPSKRIDEILGQSEAALLIVTDGGPREPRATPVLDVATSWPADEELDWYQPRGGELAYVIFTSGSSGKPKGVRINQAALGNLIHWHVEAFALGPDDRCTKFAGPGFDATVWEIFPTLAAGASLHIVPRALLAKPDALNAFFEQHAIRVSFLPTAVCERFLGVANRSLRVLLTGGEALKLGRHAGNYRLVNNYGPTENTVVSTSGTVTGDRLDIGKPITNTQVYILDRRARPVALGAAGELYLGGASLADGYVEGDPRRAFVRCAAVAPERLYRTGDRGRFLDDGRIEFLGRADEQVQLFGVRVELSEIEAALLRVPGLEGGCAVIATDRAGRPALCCAYQAPEHLSEETIWVTLREYLPRSMLPSRLLRVPELALTPNGKVDRKAVAEACAANISSGERREPTTAEATQILAAMAAILSCDPAQLSVDDDFFWIGGDSMRALELATLLSKRLGIVFDLSHVLDGRTAARMARALGTATRERPPILAAPVRESYAVSGEQERLYYLWRLAQHAKAYNVVHLFDVVPPLTVELLEQGLRALVTRHSVLRTRFIEVDGELRQSIDDNAVLPVAHVLTDLPGADVDIDPYLRAFDLERGPLAAATFIRSGDDKQLLLLDVHHVALDARSFALLMRELGQLCRGARLPPPGIDYKDYCEWRIRQRPEREGELERFWRARFETPAPVLELPQRAERSPVQSFVGGRVRSSWDGRHHAAVRELARASGATPFVVVLGVLAWVLGKLSSSTEVVVGTPHDRRAHPDLSGVIGMFAGTLPLRVNLTSADDVLAYLRETGESVRACLQHGDADFGDIVRWARPKTAPGRNSLFDVMLVVTERQPALGTGPLSLRPTSPRSAKFDLLLDVGFTDTGAEVELEYRTDLYGEAFALDLRERLASVLLQFAVPGQRLARVTALLGGERAELVTLLRGSTAVLPEPGRIHSQYDCTARHYSRLPALVEGGRELTFEEVVAEANRVAHGLRSLGVKAADRVLVLVGRSARLTCLALGIAKLGAVYVPVDPRLPAARIKTIAEDSGAGLAICAADDPAADALRDTVRVYAPEACMLGEGSQNIDVPVPPSAPVAVIYTSGSTGVPKGVLMTHQTVLNALVQMQELFPLTHDGALSFRTSPVFDVSLMELFSGAVSNGRVVIFDSRDEADPRKLLRALSAGISHLNLVPSHLDALLVNLEADPALRAGWTQLKYLFVAGEPLMGSLVERLRASGFVGELVNIYGPSETFYTTWYRVPAKCRYPAGVPIGRPFANLAMSVRDASGDHVPLGSVGELWVTGLGVSPGYCRGEIAESGFAPVPGTGDEHTYRTGDLVRLGEGGALTFCGRRDNQLKLFGKRVECGEVERVLVDSGVDGHVAVVPVRRDGVPTGLHAFVTSATVDDAELFARARARLPAYMMPVRIHNAAQLPRTSSGKIDRKALERQAEAHVAHEAAATDGADSGARVPKTLTEERLLTILQHLVHAPLPLDPNADLFDGGLTSLLTMKLLARIRSEFGVDLELSDVFSRSTLRALGGSVDQRLGAGACEDAAQPLVTLSRGRLDGVFAIPGIHGHAVGFTELARALPDVGLCALEPISLGARALAPLEDWDAMVEAYAARIRQHRPSGPIAFIGHSSGGLMAVTLAEHFTRLGRNVAVVAALDSYATFEGDAQRWVLDQAATCALGLDFARFIFGNFEKFSGMSLDLDSLSDGPTLTARLSDRLRRAGLDPSSSPERVESYLLQRKAHERAVVRRYGQAPGCFAGTLHLFKASELLPHQSPDPRPDYGWSQWGTQVQIHSVPGDHESLIRPPQVGELARILTELLHERM